jgi:DNA-binding MarR family transcriptional regulator
MDGSDETREIGQLLAALLGQVAAGMDRGAAESGLPPAQACALARIDAPVSMQELAARLSCHGSNVTGITDRLAARGLVERQDDPADRRVKRVGLTPAGAATRDRMRASLRRGPHPLDRLSDEQRRQLRDLLRQALDPEVSPEETRRRAARIGAALRG